MRKNETNTECVVCVSIAIIVARNSQFKSMWASTNYIKINETFFCIQLSLILADTFDLTLAVDVTVILWKCSGLLSPVAQLNVNYFANYAKLKWKIEKSKSRRVTLFAQLFVAFNFRWTLISWTNEQEKNSSKLIDLVRNFFKSHVLLQLVGALIRLNVSSIAPILFGLILNYFFAVFCSVLANNFCSFCLVFVGWKVVCLTMIASALTNDEYEFNFVVIVAVRTQDN